MNTQLSYLTKDEILKSEISSILMDTKDELNRFKKEVERTENNLKEIKNIQRELSDIQGRLKNLEHIGKDIKKLYKEAGQMLEGKRWELTKINRDIISEGKAQIIVLIDNNLPDYMKLNVLEATEERYIIELVEHENIQSKPIGTVQFIEDGNQNILRIKIEKDLEFKDFEIENPFRIYNVVNYIISTHGYKPNGKKLK